MGIREENIRSLAVRRPICRTNVSVKFSNTMPLLLIVFCDVEMPINTILGDLQMKSIPRLMGAQKRDRGMDKTVILYLDSCILASAFGWMLDSGFVYVRGLLAKMYGLICSIGH